MGSAVIDRPAVGAGFEARLRRSSARRTRSGGPGLRRGRRARRAAPRAARQRVVAVGDGLEVGDCRRRAAQPSGRGGARRPARGRARCSCASRSSTSASARICEMRDSVTPSALGDLGHRPLGEEVLLHHDPHPLGQLGDRVDEVGQPLLVQSCSSGVGAGADQTSARRRARCRPAARGPGPGRRRRRVPSTSATLMPRRCATSAVSGTAAQDRSQLRCGRRRGRGRGGGRSGRPSRRRAARRGSPRGCGWRRSGRTARRARRRRHGRP